MLEAKRAAPGDRVRRLEDAADDREHIMIDAGFTVCGLPVVEPQAADERRTIVCLACRQGAAVLWGSR